MGPRNLEQSVDGAVVAQIQRVVVRDGKVLERTFCSDGEHRVAVEVPIEVSLLPLVQGNDVEGKEKSMLVIICDDKQMLEKYGQAIAMVQNLYP
jgi:hypothetical protein